MMRNEALSVVQAEYGREARTDSIFEEVVYIDLGLKHASLPHSQNESEQ